jgi:hypothetical protein
MPSLLKAREVEARGRLEELAGQVAVAQTELGRLVITRETVEALLGPGAGEPRRGGDDRSARMSERRLSPSPLVGSVLPEAVAAALGVVEASDVPLRAREVCEALGRAGRRCAGDAQSAGTLGEVGAADRARAGPARRAGPDAVSAVQIEAGGDAGALEEAFAASRSAYQVLEAQMTSVERPRRGPAGDLIGRQGDRDKARGAARVDGQGRGEEGHEHLQDEAGFG